MIPSSNFVDELLTLLRFSGVCVLWKEKEEFGNFITFLT